MASSYHTKSQADVFYSFPKPGGFCFKKKKKVNFTFSSERKMKLQSEQLEWEWERASFSVLLFALFNLPLGNMLSRKAEMGTRLRYLRILMTNKLILVVLQ